MHTTGLARQPLTERAAAERHYKLEPVLDETSNTINAALGETDTTFSKARRLLYDAACDALHASNGRLGPPTRTLPCCGFPARLTRGCFAPTALAAR